MSTNWFNVDKAGLAAILERRGKAFALFELISNAWDSGTDRVVISIVKRGGEPYADLSVEDWGDGFMDLSHANTMFARSSRASDPSKRGRFNLGEKLVLSVCKSARIETTTGAVTFGLEGVRNFPSQKRERGTLFNCCMRMTNEEHDDAMEALRLLIPPVSTTLNERAIEPTALVTKFTAKLPTEIGSEDGSIRRSTRTCEVEVYEGEGRIYELGIPVVEDECGYRVNVLQKVPLNMERDNVLPSFRKALIAQLMNAIHDRLTPEEASKPWAAEALESPLVKAEAVKSVITTRFGERAVVANPTDPIANATAAAHGYTVVPGNTLSSQAWSNVRKYESLLPSSRVFPTAKPEAMAARNEASGVCPLCNRPM